MGSKTVVAGFYYDKLASYVAHCIDSWQLSLHTSWSTDTTTTAAESPQSLSGRA